MHQVYHAGKELDVLQKVSLGARVETMGRVEVSQRKYVGGEGEQDSAY